MVQLDLVQNELLQVLTFLLIFGKDTIVVVIDIAIKIEIWFNLFLTFILSINLYIYRLLTKEVQF